MSAMIKTSSPVIGSEAITRRLRKLLPWSSGLVLDLAAIWPAGGREVEALEAEDVEAAGAGDVEVAEMGDVEVAGAEAVGSGEAEAIDAWDADVAGAGDVGAAEAG